MSGPLYETQAFARASKDAKFKQITIKRGGLTPDDVEFDIKYCGICHSDVHTIEDILGRTQFPCVPGHELAGIVTKVKHWKIVTLTKTSTVLTSILGWQECHQLQGWGQGWCWLFCG